MGWGWIGFFVVLFLIVLVKLGDFIFYVILVLEEFNLEIFLSVVGGREKKEKIIVFYNY